MKIINKKTESQNQFTFKDLCIGECFLDQDGDLCIKTSETGCIVTVLDGETCWIENAADLEDPVELLKATLLIE